MDEEMKAKAEQFADSVVELGRDLRGLVLSENIDGALDVIESIKDDLETLRKMLEPLVKE
jgi:hypothetical protein